MRVDNRRVEERPYVSNYPDLVKWLNEISAFCNWQIMRGPEDAPQAAVEGWSANGRVFIIQVFSERRGWEIYTACDSNRIDVTLGDAKNRLGVR